MMPALTNTARSSAPPSLRSRRRLSFSPMENIRNTRPACAAVPTRASSVTSENGGVCGPTIMPATR